MTEEEWFARTSPGLLLAHLDKERGETQRPGGRRKLRLFACACVRGIWALLRQPESYQAVEVAERFADGLASEKEIADARAAAREATRREVPEITKSHFWSSAAAAEGVLAEGFHGAEGVFHAPYSCATAWAWTQNTPGLFHSKVNAWEVGQIKLLRDIFGNPFRPVTLNPACLTPTIIALAHAAYDERILPHGELDSLRLAVLADALEEAGAAAELVAHLREPGPHVRGCFAVDALLSQPA